MGSSGTPTREQGVPLALVDMMPPSSKRRSQHPPSMMMGARTEHRKQTCVDEERMEKLETECTELRSDLASLQGRFRAWDVTLTRMQDY